MLTCSSFTLKVIPNPSLKVSLNWAPLRMLDSGMAWRTMCALRIPQFLASAASAKSGLRASKASSIAAKTVYGPPSEARVEMRPALFRFLSRVLKPYRFNCVGIEPYKNS